MGLTRSPQRTPRQDCESMPPGLRGLCVRCLRHDDLNPDFVAARGPRGTRKLPLDPSTTDHTDGTDRPISIRVIRAIRGQQPPLIWLRLRRAGTPSGDWLPPPARSSMRRAILSRRGAGLRLALPGTTPPCAFQGQGVSQTRPGRRPTPGSATDRGLRRAERAGTSIPGAGAPDANESGAQEPAPDLDALS
jgi:hypothetical protein